MTWLSDDQPALEAQEKPPETRDQAVEKQRAAWFRRTGRKMRPEGAWTLDPDFDESL